MRYDEYRARARFSKSELLAIAKGNLVDDPPPGGIARLPAPPMLMFDRIIDASTVKGASRIVAEQDIHPDAWFFQCHFEGDPVQPGCLGLDAIWQLTGFWSSLAGAVGSGRALGCGDVEFFGQIRPYDRVVRYEVDVKRFARVDGGRSSLVLADGRVFVDDELIYTVKKAKVGCYIGIEYAKYPDPEAPHARGGIMRREEATP